LPKFNDNILNQSAIHSNSQSAISRNSDANRNELSQLDSYIERDILGQLGDAADINLESIGRPAAQANPLYSKSKTVIIESTNDEIVEAGQVQEQEHVATTGNLITETNELEVDLDVAAYASQSKPDVPQVFDFAE